MGFNLRLDSVLVKNHLSTERRVRRLLQTHTVTINGKQVYQGGVPVNVWKDVIQIDGKDVSIIPDYYLIMNKNGGTVCSSTEGDDRSVLELVDKKYHFIESHGPLHTVGRLDKDTEGMLILTTDGDLSHNLTDPKSHINKTYFVRLRDQVNEENKLLYIKKCSEGFFIPREKMENSFTSKPAVLEFLSSNECYLTITEGKFHQVKRMFLALHNEVVYLKRVAMGSLKLDESIPCGCYRELTQEELVLLTSKVL